MVGWLGGWVVRWLGGARYGAATFLSPKSPEGATYPEPGGLSRAASPGGATYPEPGGLSRAASPGGATYPEPGGLSRAASPEGATYPEPGVERVSAKPPDMIQHNSLKEPMIMPSHWLLERVIRNS